MSGPEKLTEYELDFLFEDNTNPNYIETVTREVINDRYEDVDNTEIIVEEMGGTTYFAYFEASGERVQKSVFDSNPDEIRARIYALFHL